MTDPEATAKSRTFHGIAPGVMHLENVVELEKGLAVCSPQNPPPRNMQTDVSPGSCVA
jgi:hypothetical protein